MDLSEAYLAAALEQLVELQSTQLPAIRRAADLLADTWRDGGRLLVARTHHTLHGELLNRAGGPVAAAVLDDGGATHEQMVEHLPNVQTGDLVLVHSNCGSTRKTVSIAEAARRQGAATVALTQVGFEQSELVRPERPSGRFLHEVADVTVDLGGVVGDGAVEIPGTQASVGPTSGLTGIAAAWAIIVGSCELLAADGASTPILKAVQLPGAEAHNLAAIDQYGARSEESKFGRS